jgi:beta-N-acetylhexosaminidase
LARATLRGLLAGGVQPVMKHIPGHGRARADSHLELPVVDAPAEALGRDLVPFRGLAGMAPWAMTAHVTYTALDADRCATLSPEIIRNTIRRRAGFHGVLITDDLRMKALSGEVAANARAALAAGCDVALDCAPGPDEWTRLGESLPPMRPASWRRLSRARRLAGRLAGRRHLAFDAAAAARELATLLAGARQAS